MINVDARGLSCPQPVILTKNALASKPEKCVVTVDNGAAKENVSRLASSLGYTVKIAEANSEYTLNLSK